MFRIGLVGGECSHAEYFAYYFNQKNDRGEYNFPNYRVTAISGHYKKENTEIAERFGLENVYDDPADMLGKIDAVMVTARDGKYHYGFAEPFLKIGMPAFINKPITTDYAEAKALVKLAEDNNALICGGSTLKYSKHVLDLAKIVRENKSSVFGAQIVTPVHTNCEYSGFWFYASHLVEVCLTIFGKDIESLYASNNGGNVSVIFDYDGFSVVGQYANECIDCYQMTLILAEKNIVKPVDDGACLKVGCEKFVEMIEKKKPVENYNDLIFPVFVIEKIIESYSTGKKIVLGK